MSSLARVVDSTSVDIGRRISTAAVAKADRGDYRSQRAPRPSTCSTEALLVARRRRGGLGSSAATTWIFRGDESPRRRGDNRVIPWRRGDAAAKSWIFRGDESTPRPHELDRRHRSWYKRVFPSKDCEWVAVGASRGRNRCANGAETECPETCDASCAGGEPTETPTNSPTDIDYSDFTCEDWNGGSCDYCLYQKSVAAGAGRGCKSNYWGDEKATCEGRTSNVNFDVTIWCGLETPAPSLVPTVSPAVWPTLEPTATTGKPTTTTNLAPPTGAPTEAPTEAPTDAPTDQPTGPRPVPVPTLSLSPSASPTMVLIPTPHPTIKTTTKVPEPTDTPTVNCDPAFPSCCDSSSRSARTPTGGSRRIVAISGRGGAVGLRGGAAGGRGSTVGLRGGAVGVRGGAVGVCGGAAADSDCWRPFAGAGHGRRVLPGGTAPGSRLGRTCAAKGRR